MTSPSLLKDLSEAQHLNEWLLSKDWELSFENRTLKRARSYSRNDRVLKIETAYNAKGDLQIYGEVKGNDIYHPVITITPVSDQSSFYQISESLCSCPVTFNCKHSASILYSLSELLKRNESAKKSPDEFLFDLPTTPVAPKLERRTQFWLETLAQTQKSSTPDATTKTAAHTILTYCLEAAPRPKPGAPEYLLYLRPASLKKNGQTSIRESESNITPNQVPQYISQEHKLTALTYWSMRPNRSQLPLISQAEYGPIILHACNTKRLYFKTNSRTESYQPVTQGPTLEATLSWSLESNGTSHPIIELSDSSAHFLPTEPALYLNPKSNEIGTVSSKSPLKLLLAWLKGPPISAEQASLVCSQLPSASSDLGLALPPPSEFKQKEISPHTLTPILRITSAQLMHWEETENLIGQLLYQYEDSPRFTPMTSGSKKKEHWTTDNEIKTVTRSHSAERAFEHKLQKFELQRVCDVYRNYGISPEVNRAFLIESSYQAESLSWLIWLEDHRAILEREGWTIEIDPDCGLLLHEVSGFEAELAEAPEHGIDWFEFQLTADHEDNPVNLIPYVAEFLSQGFSNLEPNELPEFIILPHPNEPNQFLRFPSDRFLEICKTIAHLFQGKTLDPEGRLRVDRLGAASVAHELNLNADQTTKALAKLGKSLSTLTELPAKNPAKDFQADLRPYQLEGFRWLHFLANHQLNGILADDMGLGKTVQTLAFLSTLPRSGKKALPSLIVAPTSVIANWSLEAERFTPKLKVLLLQGSERKELFGQIGKHHLVLTSYPLLHRDREVLLSQEWQAVILDEAQYIKNPKTHAAQVACQLKCNHRFCLSGTPMENHLGELWSLMNFAMPSYLGDQKTFSSQVRRPIESQRDPSIQRALNRRLAPLLLRRTKDEVAQDLPPKTEIIHSINLTKKESDLYESVRAAMDKRVRDALAAKGLAQSQIIILDALLKLRQICCHPSLLKTESAQKVQTASKMNFLTKELLPELFTEGRRILLFSQFTSVLSIIEKQLKEDQISYLKLTGQTKNRAALVKKFQTEDIPIFLISLKAGGTGLTLTAADTVIHYDPWWNPAAENQATDRAHRIGQTKPVFIHKLICQGSIEDHILTLQRHKANLVKNLLSDETTKLKIDTETLSQLFEPLT